jgi:hypothetical protein
VQGLKAAQRCRKIKPQQHWRKAITCPESISHESKADGTDAGAYDLHAAVEAGDGTDVLPAKAHRKNLWLRDEGDTILN